LPKKITSFFLAGFRPGYSDTDRILRNANGGMAFMAAWWGIWQMVTGIGLAVILARIPMLTQIRLLQRSSGR